MVRTAEKISSKLPSDENKNSVAGIKTRLVPPQFESQADIVLRKEAALKEYMTEPSTIINIMEGNLGLTDISKAFKMHTDKVKKMLQEYYNQEDVGGPDFYTKYISNRIKNHSNNREDKKNELMVFLSDPGIKERFEKRELSPTKIYDDFNISLYEDVITCLVSVYGIRWANEMGFVMFPVKKDIKERAQIEAKNDIVENSVNVFDFNNDFRKQKAYPQKYKNYFPIIAQEMIKGTNKTIIFDKIIHCHGRTFNEIIYDSEFRSFFNKYAQENNIEEKEAKHFLLKYLLVEDRIKTLRLDLSNNLYAIKSGEVTIYQTHLMKAYHLSLPPILKVLKEFNIVTDGHKSWVESTITKDVENIDPEESLPPVIIEAEQILEADYPINEYFPMFEELVKENPNIVNMPDKLEYELDDMPLELIHKMLEIKGVKEKYFGNQQVSMEVQIPVITEAPNLKLPENQSENQLKKINDTSKKINKKLSKIEQNEKDLKSNKLNYQDNQKKQKDINQAKSEIKILQVQYVKDVLDYINILILTKINKSPDEKKDIQNSMEEYTTILFEKIDGSEHKEFEEKIESFLEYSQKIQEIFDYIKAGFEEELVKEAKTNLLNNIKVEDDKTLILTMFPNLI